MKTSAVLFIVALLFLVAGCSENAVNPIVAPPSVRPTPISQRLQLDQKIEFVTPDGASIAANLEGEITYQMTKVDPASLSKEIPNTAKAAYRLTMVGQGEMSFSQGEASASLHKPITWTFSRTLADIVEEGGEFTATFPINGTRYQMAQLHLGFVLSNNKLVQDLAYVDFQEKPSE
jgi:hypothetical protein